jgi:hypothetical protein
MNKSQWKLFVTLLFALGIGIFILISNDTSSQATTGIHVSENMPIGIVVTQGEDLGGGIYLIQIEVGIKENPTRYPAITSNPTQFPIGSRAALKNITAIGTNSFNDMFHVAIKP